MSAPPQSELELLDAARAGDEGAFDLLVTPYRRELHVHAYRMLGSLDDADDALQETFVRAWRQVGSYEPRAPFRAWLYRIITNACLTMLSKSVRTREVPIADLSVIRSGSTSGEAEMLYLDPYPDPWLEHITTVQQGPEAIVEAAESVQLAFVAAVQALPPRQRAAVLLRDVLGYAAADVAGMLESSVASVNSALQRARVTLERERSSGTVSRRHGSEDTNREDLLVSALVSAWKSADVKSMVSLLREDALLAMPPEPVHFIGRDAIAWFFRTVPAGGHLERFRFIRIRANRQPAVAAYCQEADNEPFVAHGIVVLSIENDQIASITRFAPDRLFDRFGLPTNL